MRDRLPVSLENNELPVEERKENNKKNNYGYVSFMYLLSLLITIFSMLFLMYMGNK